MRQAKVQEWVSICNNNYHLVFAKKSEYLRFYGQTAKKAAENDAVLLNKQTPNVILNNNGILN